MAGLNIVFVASEASPLAKTGGLADVAGSLPHALQHLGHDVTVILPYYRQHIAALEIDVVPLDDPIHLWADGQHRWIPLHEVTVEGLRFILVEQDDLFDRVGLYGPPGGAFEDNPLRFTLFTRAALEAACRLGRPVDIFHCHDWQTAMLPLLLHRQYLHQPAIADAKCVYTIHNLAYQGVFSPDWVARLGIPADLFHPAGYEFHAHANFMKAGILMADHVTTVSSTYAEEILTPEYGWGLDGFLHLNSDKLSGIVNGLDVSEWNPGRDKLIAKTYAPGRMKGKQECKADLQDQGGLEQNPDTPILTMVSRLAEQKGVDLVLTGVLEWLHAGYQVVLLGSGDPAYESILHNLADAHPKQMYFHGGFDEQLAHKIYAGGDIFLMPSRFEPCGLGQLMAMRYGNIPVARATGGLKDTVLDYDVDKASATGFTFVEAEANAFKEAVGRAIEVFQNKSAWRRLVGQAMRRDSSWEASAEKYLEIYQSLLRD